MQKVIRKLIVSFTKTIVTDRMKNISIANRRNPS